MTRTCVIGAGGSGLVAAKTLLAHDHDVVVFERADQLGGVWAPWRAFPGLATQTPAPQFAFSDFPFLAELGGWPLACDVYAYLRAYADQFRITERIRFGAEVIRLDRGPDQRWTVAVRRGDEVVEELVDYVVVSTGIFDHPVVPEVPGQAAYEAAGGTVLHSACCTDPNLFDGRTVVVVGFQKSATDLAVYAVEHGSNVHMVYRRARWRLPRRFLGAVSISDTIYTRVFEGMTRLATSVPHPAPRQRVLHRIIARPASLQFRALELILRAQFRLGSGGMLPQNGVEEEAHCGITIETPGFYVALRGGRIAAHRTVVDRLEPRTVVLGTGERILADVVIYATGYELQLPFLAPSIYAEVFDSDGYLRLYRNVLPPTIPTLGFVGFNSAIASPLAAEVAAHWLAEHWSARMTLPDVDVMHEHIAAELAWRMKHWPDSTRALRNACVGLQYRYMDCLMREMGRPPKVRGIRAGFRAMQPNDYATLLARGDPPRFGR